MIEGEHITRAEAMLRSAFSLGIDPHHSHQLMANRIRIDEVQWGNYLLERMGDISNHMAAAKDQHQRDAIMATALRHMFAVGALAQLASEGKG